jgi:hypothetical protein
MPAAAQLKAERLKAFMALEPGIRDIDRQCDILLELIEAKAHQQLIDQAARQASKMARELVKVWYEPEGGLSS